MNKNISQKITFEIVWWLVTAIVCFMVYSWVNRGVTSYPYLMENMALIAIFITITRWAFLLRISLISESRNLMIGLIFLMIPLFIFSLTEYRAFKMFWDEGSLIPFLNGDSYDSKMAVANFFRQEMIFFAVGSMIATLIFPFRMVRAIWRKHNKGYV